MLRNIEMGVGVAWVISAASALIQTKLWPYMALVFKQFGVLVRPDSLLLVVAATTLAGAAYGIIFGLTVGKGK